MINADSTSKTATKKQVMLTVKREFTGNKTLFEALTPVIIEDLRRQSEQLRTLDGNAD